VLCVLCVLNKDFLLSIHVPEQASAGTQLVYRWMPVKSGSTWGVVAFATSSV
jgi:hypothetical protein